MISRVPVDRDDKYIEHRGAFTASTYLYFDYVKPALRQTLLTGLLTASSLPMLPSPTRKPALTIPAGCRPCLISRLLELDR